MGKTVDNGRTCGNSEKGAYFSLFPVNFKYIYSK